MDKPLSHQARLWEEWRDWSLRQKYSILIDDWVQVAHCQRSKDKIQTELMGSSRNPAPHLPSELLGQIQLLERELIELIDSCVASTRTEIQELDSTQRKLKKLGQSYGARKQSFRLSTSS
jgi:hypothetical protein